MSFESSCHELSRKSRTVVRRPKLSPKTLPDWVISESLSAWSFRHQKVKISKIWRQHRVPRYKKPPVQSKLQVLPLPRWEKPTLISYYLKNGPPKTTIFVITFFRHIQIELWPHYKLNVPLTHNWDHFHGFSIFPGDTTLWKLSHATLHFIYIQ